MEYAVGEARLERELDESEGGELVQPPAVAVGALCELERGGASAGAESAQIQQLVLVIWFSARSSNKEFSKSGCNST